MSKRGRSGNELTGGSGDVNPQTMSPFVVQPGNDTTGVFQQQLPTPRLPIRKGKSLVVELLSVDWFNVLPLLSGANNSVLGILTTNPSAFGSITAALQDPRVLSAFYRNVAYLQGTAVGFTTTASNYPFQDDLTDAAGHGILVATDKMFLFCYSVGTGQPNEVVTRINYRFKEVDLEEYIGIVQSQQ